MSTNEEIWPGSFAAMQATMKLFAACAVDDEAPDRTIGILAAIEEVHSNCPGPREWHTALFTATRVAGAMVSQTTGHSEPAGLQFLGLDGKPRPVDEVPPAIRFAARWMTAAINNDMEACLDLWFGVDVSEQEAHEVTEQMIPMLVAFITGAVRMFLATGKPFDASLLLPQGGAQ